MSAPIEVCTNGQPDTLTLPHEVVSRHLLEGVSLARAWREHLGRTQAEVAEALEVTQGQIAQWEASDAHPRQATLKRLAEVFGLHVSQLTLAEDEATS